MLAEASPNDVLNDSFDRLYKPIQLQDNEPAHVRHGHWKS